MNHPESPWPRNCLKLLYCEKYCKHKNETPTRFGVKEPDLGQKNFCLRRKKGSYPYRSTPHGVSLQWLFFLAGNAYYECDACYGVGGAYFVYESDLWLTALFRWRAIHNYPIWHALECMHLIAVCLRHGTLSHRWVTMILFFRVGFWLGGKGVCARSTDPWTRSLRQIRRYPSRANSTRQCVWVVNVEAHACTLSDGKKNGDDDAC